MSGEVKKTMSQISEINKKGAWIALLATVIHRNKIMLFINGCNCYKFQFLKLLFFTKEPIVLAMSQYNF